MNKRRKILSLLLAGSIAVQSGMLYVEAAQEKNNRPVAGISEEFMQMISARGEAKPSAGADKKAGEAKPSAGTEQKVGEAKPSAGADKKAGEAKPSAGADKKVGEAKPSAGAEQEAGVEVHEVPETKSEYEDIAIAQVNNYVNVREWPSTESEVLGKLYNHSAATVLQAIPGGWYQIKSGTVTGFVKEEYVVVGDEELARSVGTRYATVTTTTLFVRREPTTESAVLTMLPEGDDLEVLDESAEGWVKVSTVEGEGYVSVEYVSLSTEYVQAESKQEEAERLAREEAERRAAAEAARKAREEAEKKAAAEAARRAAETAKSQPQNTGNGQNRPAQSGGTAGNSQSKPAANPGSVSNGQAVVDYAKKFLGNPYVYGGTSLTNGADCSGFVQSVYRAFGISLPRNSAAQRGAGYAVSLDAIQPGDLVCYSGHIGIYAGNNTLIHASNERTGITLTSPITYRKILAVRRIF